MTGFPWRRIVANMRMAERRKRIYLYNKNDPRNVKETGMQIIEASQYLMMWASQALRWTGTRWFKWRRQLPFPSGEGPEHCAGSICLVKPSNQENWYNAASGWKECPQMEPELESLIQWRDSQVAFKHHILILYFTCFSVRKICLHLLRLKTKAASAIGASVQLLFVVGYPQ